MAVSHSSPETIATTTSREDSRDLNNFYRRKPSSSTTGASSNSTSETEVQETDNSATGDHAAGVCDVDSKDRPTVVANRENRAERTDIKFTYRPSTPAHLKVKESPLSSAAIFKQSHAGLFNLCIVVLVAVNSRLIIENLMKYGWLIRTGFWFSSRSLRDWPLFMCCLTLPVFPLAAFVVEKLAQRSFISELVVIFLHVIITTVAVLYPVIVIVRCDSVFLSGVTLMLFGSIVWLKLVSFAHTSNDMRTLAKSGYKGDAQSSSPSSSCAYDVSLRSLVYFMVAPTLCYQASYPRTACVRKGWVIRQFIKLIIFTGFMGFIIEQYINPIVQNSQHPLQGDFLYAIERVLKLSVPILYVWLCMFYCFFHLWLNILAELLCFGDREFYKDWWNARTVGEYWRMWNMPVHKWMVRHLYFPCMRHGIPKGAALVIAFFVSAVFHELCVAVPCHVFKLWAFIGIMFQIPLVMITEYLQSKFRNSMVGNMIFWLSFCVFGQPMSVLLYYHDLMNQKEE